MTGISRYLPVPPTENWLWPSNLLRNKCYSPPTPIEAVRIEPRKPSSQSGISLYISENFILTLLICQLPPVDNDNHAMDLTRRSVLCAATSSRFIYAYYNFIVCYKLDSGEMNPFLQATRTRLYCSLLQSSGMVGTWLVMMAEDDSSFGVWVHMKEYMCISILKLNPPLLYGHLTAVWLQVCITGLDETG